MARNHKEDSLMQSVSLQMARNPMTDSLVQYVWLQLVRNPMVDSLVHRVGADGQEPDCGLPCVFCVAAD